LRGGFLGEPSVSSDLLGGWSLGGVVTPHSSDEIFELGGENNILSVLEFSMDRPKLFNAVIIYQIIEFVGELGCGEGWNASHHNKENLGGCEIIDLNTFISFLARISGAI
jgi:hypothetical protein